MCADGMCVCACPLATQRQRLLQHILQTWRMPQCWTDLSTLPYCWTSFAPLSSSPLCPGAKKATGDAYRKAQVEKNAIIELVLYVCVFSRFALSKTPTTNAFNMTPVAVGQRPQLRGWAHKQLSDMFSSTCPCQSYRIVLNTDGTRSFFDLK